MQFVHDPPRQVVPRWRAFKESLRRGELLPTSIVERPRFTEEHVAEQVHDWKETPSLSVAADLVSVAFTLSLDKIAAEAALYILEQPSAPAAARGIAELYLSNAGFNIRRDEPPTILLPGYGSPARAFLTPADRPHASEISRLRARLRDYPRNPIEWCNLAFHYTSLGQMDKAEQAVTIALRLAPNNRFVLRASSRFFLHVGQWHRSHEVLARSPLVRSDPWILAAEIATAAALNQSSRWVKKAKRILELGRFGDQHVSELASAIGTLEHKAGNTKAARVNIGRSLRQPSENAIAQALWVSRKLDRHLHVPQKDDSPEAAAWAAYGIGRWDISLDQTRKWQEDQPFSSRPASHGSFIASILFDDSEEVTAFAAIGLRSNPDDVVLLNNAAFAAALAGDTSKAEDLLRDAGGAGADNEVEVATLATRGLIAFRSGRHDEGRRLYGQAIFAARYGRDREREVRAFAYLAMEELRVGSSEALQMCEEAVNMLRQLGSPLGRLLADKVIRHLDRSAQRISSAAPDPVVVGERRT